MNISKCTKMKREVINTNAFFNGEWEQSKERGFHVDGASVLRLIKVPDG